MLLGQGRESPAPRTGIGQEVFLDLTRSGADATAFQDAFAHGDHLFETDFTLADGVGARVGNGSHFTRVPRADLTGPGEWAMHWPRRSTGPNAVSCTSCHIQSFEDGSGSIVGNAVRDPLHSGRLKDFIERNTPHVFGLGAVQRLAEEMTVDLARIEETTRADACARGAAASRLLTKGTDFGVLTAQAVSRGRCEVVFDRSGVAGVADDLVVRPFQWKGTIASIRAFTRDAAHEELGLQAVELVGDGVDGDGDGVADELSVGDITAVTVYLAAQPRPTTSRELAALGLIAPLDPDVSRQIQAGEAAFASLGCASCHRPAVALHDPVFSEPSRVAAFRDDRFPAGSDPVLNGVDPRFPVSVDLTRDQPDNQLRDRNGRVSYRLGSLRRNARGDGVAELYGDLKRHDMGPELAESIDEAGTGAAVFLTKNLWAWARPPRTCTMGAPPPWPRPSCSTAAKRPAPDRPFGRPASPSARA